MGICLAAMWTEGREKKKRRRRRRKREERQEEERDSPPPSPPLHPHALAQRGHDMWESSGRAYMYSVEGEALTEERKKEKEKTGRREREREREVSTLWDGEGRR